MMSYLDGLLACKDPLDASEIEDLESWLHGLQFDCDMFGAAEGDVVKMALIKGRLQLEAALSPGDQS
jgi:hypothetical protein